MDSNEFITKQMKKVKQKVLSNYFNMENVIPKNKRKSFIGKSRCEGPQVRVILT